MRVAQQEITRKGCIEQARKGYPGTCKADSPVAAGFNETIESVRSWKGLSVSLRLRGSKRREGLPAAILRAFFSRLSPVAPGLAVQFGPGRGATLRSAGERRITLNRSTHARPGTPPRRSLVVRLEVIRLTSTPRFRNPDQ